MSEFIVFNLGKSWSDGYVPKIPFLNDRSTFEWFFFICARSMILKGV